MGVSMAATAPPTHPCSCSNCSYTSCRTFADGFPNLFVKDATRIRNRHVAFLASFQHPISIFEQLSIIYQLPRMFVGSFTVVLPYFPTGTAERVSINHSCNQMIASTCTALSVCPNFLITILACTYVIAVKAVFNIMYSSGSHGDTYDIIECCTSSLGSSCGSCESCGTTGRSRRRCGHSFHAGSDLVQHPLVQGWPR